MPEELTVKEAAERHGITVSWLIRNLDQIQHRQIGPMYLVDAESVATWAANRRRRGGSQKGVPWSKKKPQGQGDRQPVEQREPEVARPALLVSPVPVVKRSQPAPAMQAERQHPAPQETIIDLEGTHITIDPLLPDLQRWMHAEAIKGDVTAWCDIRPYPDAHWPGAYVVDYYYDRKDRNKKGAMGRNQEERAQALMYLLRDQLTEALQAQGWQMLTKTPSGQTLWHYRPGQQKEAQP